MEIKTVRKGVGRAKIGFFAALCVLLGSVVGIGIFFKNASVGRGVGHEGLAWMLAWVVGGILALSAAIAFSEIGRLGSSRISGLGFWASLVGGRRFGHFVAIGFAVLYLGADTAIIAILVSEIFFSMFGVTFSNIPPAAALTIHFFMGILFTAALLTCKRISIKGSGWVQVVTTCIKFMPLIVAAFIGIIIASISGGSTAEAEVATAATQTTFTPLTRMLRIFGVMPAVLFAYDSFINVASMTRRVKNGEKRMPFIIFFGLTVIIVLYTLVGFSSALTKTSTVSDMFKLLTTDQSVAFYLGKFIDVTIFVSAFGVLNGISMVYDTAMTNLVEIGALAGSEKAKKKFGKHTSLFYMVVTLSVLFIISGLVSIPFGTDIIIDGISSYVSMIFFIVYGAVVLLYTIKRKRFEITKLNPVAFYTSAISSVIGISIAVIFFVVSVITDTVSSEFSTLGWGLFADYGFQLRSFLPLVIFFLYILALFVLHVVNVFLVKREGRDVLAIIAAQKPQVEEEEEGCDSSCDSEKGCGLKGEAKETEKSTE